MNHIHKSITLGVLAIFLALSLTLNASSQTASNDRPALVLLCDATKEASWINATNILREHFNILIVDTAKHSNPASIHATIRNTVTGEYRVSSTEQAHEAATQYATIYKNETKQFILPNNSKDLLQLSQLFHHFLNT